MSSASPNSCSGAMYGIEPTTVPDSVIRPVAFPPERSTARPKSRIFGCPSAVSMTLPGFRSRWRTPCRWAFSSASAIAAPSWSTASSGSGPAASRDSSVPPGTYSMTRKSSPSWASKSKTVATPGWESRDSARASRRKRSRVVAWSSAPRRSILMATTRSRLASCAFHTTPIPPSPMRSTSRYRPRRVPVPTAVLSLADPRPVTGACACGKGRERVSAPGKATARERDAATESPLRYQQQIPCAITGVRRPASTLTGDHRRPTKPFAESGRLILERGRARPRHNLT